MPASNSAAFPIFKPSARTRFFENAIIAPTSRRGGTRGGIWIRIWLPTLRLWRMKHSENKKKEKQCLAVDEEVREQPAEKTLSDFERLSASTSRCNEELTDVDEANISAGAF